MVRFDVSSLIKTQPGTTLTWEISTGPRKLEDLEVGYLRGVVRVTRVQAGLLVQGTLESQLSLECVRCLEPFDLQVALELEETFRLPGTGFQPEMPYAVEESGWLDLAPLLREQGWLAIPMKPLCKPSCKGMCPHCGVNLNIESCTCQDSDIDPRLALLKELL